MTSLDSKRLQRTEIFLLLGIPAQSSSPVAVELTWVAGTRWKPVTSDGFFTETGTENFPMNDLKFALRQLLKNPGFTAVAVLARRLAIGVVRPPLSH